VGGLPTGTVNGFAAHPTNPNLMFVAMREGIFRSDDAGARWTAVRGGPRNVAAVTINPRRSTVVYAATTEGGVFSSRDRGQTWELLR
jgi:photosystem II stability/assembly factor-like uncharacterized protein